MPAGKAHRVNDQFQERAPMPAETPPAELKPLPEPLATAVENGDETEKETG